MAQDQSARLFLNGNDLLARCTSAGYDAGVCEGYVMAIADAMSGGNSVLGARACIGLQVTGAQVRDVVVAALRRNPPTRHLSARSLAANAIEDAFPCH
jgi:Rap1a immunity proteins